MRRLLIDTLNLREIKANESPLRTVYLTDWKGLPVSAEILVLVFNSTSLCHGLRTLFLLSLFQRIRLCVDTENLRVDKVLGLVNKLSQHPCEYENLLQQNVLNVKNRLMESVPLVVKSLVRQ